MKITVKDYLNVRVGKPSVNAPSYQYLSPGSVIEVDERAYAGDLFEGTNTWFKDSANNYYWSGGFTDETNKEPRISLIDYNKTLNIRGERPSGKGKGIRIAIFDSGVFSEHPDFNNIEIPFKNCIDPQQVKANDLLGHGTHISGLIGARSSRTTGIRGVSPECSIEVFKVIKDNAVVKGLKIKDQLIEIATKTPADRPHIINLSLSVSQAEYELMIEPISALYNAGIVMVSAAGNDSELYTNILNPAISNKIISVGSISNAIFHQEKLRRMNPRVDFVFENYPVNSTYIKPSFYKASGECSMYTAIISGLLANYLSATDTSGDENRTELCRGFLKRTAYSLQSETELSKLKLYDAQN